MQNYKLGEILDKGYERFKWEANKDTVIKAYESGDGIHSTLYIWEGSYNPELFQFDDSGDLICDPKRGKTKTYTRFHFNTRLDGKINNGGYSFTYKKHQEHQENRADGNYIPDKCSYELNHENISQFNFKYTGDMSTLSSGNTINTLPIEWSVGDKTVLEDNGFSKNLFNALAREEHIDKPLLTNPNIFIQSSQNAINTILAPKKYRNKFADKITNFNPSTDTLRIDIDSFGIDSSATFSSGKNKKAVKKKLAKQYFDFLYDEKKGGLYFNENGADKGFGDGGIIAMLKGAPDLSADNLEFI